MKRNQQFVEEPTMSDKTLLLNVEDLINTAFGTADRNVVNFKMIQAVLHILARQMRLLEQDVEIKVDEFGLAGKPLEAYASEAGLNETKKAKRGRRKAKRDGDRMEDGGTIGRSYDEDEEYDDRDYDRSRDRGGGKARGRRKDDDRDGERGSSRGRDRDYDEDEERGGSRGRDRDYDEDGERGGSRGRDRDDDRGGEREGSRGRDRDDDRGGERGGKIEMMAGVEREGVVVAEIEMVTGVEREGVVVAEMEMMTGAERGGVVVAEIEMMTGAEREGVVVAEIEMMTGAEREGVVVEGIEMMTGAEREGVVVEGIEMMTGAEREGVIVAEVEGQIVVEIKEAGVTEIGVVSVVVLKIEVGIVVEKQKVEVEEKEEEGEEEEVGEQAAEMNMQMERETVVVLKIEEEIVVETGVVVEMLTEKVVVEKEVETQVEIREEARSEEEIEKTLVVDRKVKRKTTRKVNEKRVGTEEDEGKRDMAVKGLAGEGVAVGEQVVARGEGQWVLKVSAVVAHWTAGQPVLKKEQKRKELWEKDALQLTARVSAAERGLTQMAGLLTQLAATGALPAEMASRIGEVGSEFKRFSKSTPEVARQPVSGQGPGQAPFVGPLPGQATGQWQGQDPGQFAEQLPGQIPGSGQGMPVSTGARKMPPGSRVPPSSTTGTQGVGQGGVGHGPYSSDTGGQAFTTQPSHGVRAESTATGMLPWEPGAGAPESVSTSFRKSVAIDPGTGMPRRGDGTGIRPSMGGRASDASYKAVTHAEMEDVLLIIKDDFKKTINTMTARATHSADVAMASFQEQMAQVRTELKEGLDRLEQATTNAESAALLDLTDRYQGLVIELEHTLHTHQGLTTLQQQLSDELRADISRLTGLLHETDFMHARLELDNRLMHCYEKFTKQDMVWLTALKDLSAVAETKAEIIQLMVLKDSATMELKNIQAKLRQLYIMLGEPKAAVLMRKLAKGAACGACLTPALMELTEPKYGKPFAMPQFRPPPIGEEEPCLTKLKPLVPADTRSHVCRRWAGGSHTLVSEHVSHERAAPPALHGPPTKRYAGYGTDGRLYMLEEELQPCLECNQLDAKEPGQVIPIEPKPSPNVGAGDQIVAAVEPQKEKEEDKKNEEKENEKEKQGENEGDACIMVAGFVVPTEDLRLLVDVTSEAMAVVVSARLHDVTELVSHYRRAGAVASGDAGTIQVYC
ncbi:unnamed protein product [Spodoptera littoralis]|uniref:Uncharacterized protein n=1 Tax=Spodoptera littoralis TaxID=7109 RepID=A0A9P0MX78_SPOLI|nr:unnamed protein product [Spodoptera littoralis]CAH1636701.1 unnamed protein product [Spodoptera littoralis]